MKIKPYLYRPKFRITWSSAVWQYSRSPGRAGRVGPGDSSCCEIHQLINQLWTPASARHFLKMFRPHIVAGIEIYPLTRSAGLNKSTPFCWKSAFLDPLPRNARYAFRMKKDPFLRVFLDTHVYTNDQYIWVAPPGVPARSLYRPIKSKS